MVGAVGYWLLFDDSVVEWGGALRSAGTVVVGRVCGSSVVWGCGGRGSVGSVFCVPGIGCMMVAMRAREVSRVEET